MNKNYFQQKQLAIHNIVNGFIARGQRVFCTSSFQTQSIPLLHMLSKVDEVFVSNSISGVIPIKKIDYIEYHNFSYCNIIQKKIISLSLDL